MFNVICWAYYLNGIFNMNFFYSAGVKGYGLKNRWMHQHYNFPTLPAVTKTITYNKKVGYPFAVLKFGETIWNKVSLHNCGLYDWCLKYYKEDLFQNVIVSIAGTDEEIAIMVDFLDAAKIKGIELNFSCPNVKSYNNIKIPYSSHDLYLKLNYKQDPYRYILDNIKGIRVNSIPIKFGGLSGKSAQRKNWEFIEEFNIEGLNVAGASCLTFDDFKRMEDFGCKEIGLGTITIINPKIVTNIEQYKGGKY